MYQCADACDPAYCFPNKLEDIAVLEGAAAAYPQGAKAYYYLGNLYYDKLQFERAISLWEKSALRNDSYPTVHRNLAIAYFNKRKDTEKAVFHMEKAFHLDETDSRVFLELDQLYKKREVSFEKRLKNYEAHMEIVKKRDDAMLELVTLYNLTGKYQKAYDTIMSHVFRPWEGAEGRISGQYKIALTEMAKEAIVRGEHKKAEELLEKALEYPVNLGEGKLEGTKDNLNLYDEVKEDFFAVSLPDFLIFEDDMEKKHKAHCYYLMGLSSLGMGVPKEAKKYFKKALEYDFNNQNSRSYFKMAEQMCQGETNLQQ